MTSLEDINDPTEAMNAALTLFAKAFQLSALTNNNQRTSSNPHNRQIAQPVMNMGQDRQIQNVRGNGGNQFGQYAGQVAQNQQGFNAWQNGGIQGAQNASSGTGNVVAARAEGTGIGNQASGNNLHWQWKLILPVGTPNLAVGMPCAFYSQQIWHGSVKLKYATVTHTGNVPSNHSRLSSQVPSG
uniref:Uncharacterized protein n=1 Tax=Tanacetum cinerariifolium TaxID=118510 RepID=A0A6L2K5W8_TANCI|nr:hypothetical protein [Tanacetum cinerariifolium]